MLADVVTNTGIRLGELPAKSITPAAVDKIYEKLRGGQSGQKLLDASHTIDFAKKAWSVVQRTHPDKFQKANPVVGLTKFQSKSTIKQTTRTEA